MKRARHFYFIVLFLSGFWNQNFTDLIQCRENLPLCCDLQDHQFYRPRDSLHAQLLPGILAPVGDSSPAWELLRSWDMALPPSSLPVLHQGSPSVPGRGGGTSQSWVIHSAATELLRHLDVFGRSGPRNRPRPEQASNLVLPSHRVPPGPSGPAAWVQVQLPCTPRSLLVLSSFVVTDLRKQTVYFPPNNEPEPFREVVSWQRKMPLLVPGWRKLGRRGTQTLTNWHFKH